MKLTFKLIVAALSLTLTPKAQNNVLDQRQINKRGCATVMPSAEWDTWFNQKVSEYKLNNVSAKSMISSLTIPVIVHVLHGGQNVGTFPNISQAQIKSQIDVLNNDFAGKGLNSGFIAATGFSAVGIADCKITFCLAQLDPNNTPLAEAGIHRVNFNSEGWANPTTATDLNSFKTLMDGTIKPNTIWDPSLYYNIWVSDVNQNVGILGYATFPGGVNMQGLPTVGNSSDDGIWVWARSFGNTGTLDFTYRYGRTATHETGHWLGLRHIGGDGNNNPNGDCNATDYCDDTPPQTGGFSQGQYGQNFGAPTYPLHPFVCSSIYGDMFMNFMDYTDDYSNYMFTPDQNTRIQTTMSEGYFRNTLNASSANLCIGLAVADFYIDTLLCKGMDLQPENYTSGDPATYTWVVTPSVGVVYTPNANDAGAAINFPSEGTYTISLSASNSVGVTNTYTVVQVQDCTGLKNENIFGSNTSIFPNPNQGNFTIKSQATSNSPLHIDVVNALGEIVYVKDVNWTNTITIDIPFVSAGIYSVNITNGNEKTVKRLVITK